MAFSFPVEDVDTCQNHPVFPSSPVNTDDVRHPAVTLLSEIPADLEKFSCYMIDSICRDSLDTKYMIMHEMSQI